MSGELPFVVAAIVRGASHARAGRACEDAVGHASLPGVVVAAVADGHGSAARAERGARHAVAVAIVVGLEWAAWLGEDAGPERVDADARERLARQVHRDWLARVNQDRARDELPVSAWGSTLILAIATPRLCAVARLGDGDALRIGADVSRPLPADDLVGDETLSLCLPDAWASTRVAAGPPLAPGELLFLATDGYGKSYADDADLDVTAAGWQTWLTEGGEARLRERLGPVLAHTTAHGSGDDIAVALLGRPAPPPEPTPPQPTPPEPTPPPEEERS